MAECDERSWLAALPLMNSGIEADDGSNKTFVAVMCTINGDLGNLHLRQSIRSQFTQNPDLNEAALRRTRSRVAEPT